ncbi:hypothetical protein AC629_24875 [Bradyrhizobium sp. NAS80.1]|nr:hypothetical protein AC629_24875 [Bradyrhizobium sp. NAS80.1]
MNEIQKLTSTLSDTVAAEVQKVSAKCDALDAELKQLKADAAKRKDGGDDGSPTGYIGDPAAVRVAADSVSRTEYQVLQDQVRDMRNRMPVPQTLATRNAFADLQAKADVAYTALGERASPPMVSESILDYQVRLHRGLQQHSKKWRKTELAAIARDSSTLNSVCDEIRADAVAYGLNPPDLKPFEHRMITETMPSGHVMKRFVGNGTIFKQLSRPVRHVQYIGTRYAQ